MRKCLLVGIKKYSTSRKTVEYRINKSLSDIEKLEEQWEKKKADFEQKKKEEKAKKHQEMLAKQSENRKES